MTDIPTDWRGTPITPGRTVIYGAPVGRSIALVEATVEGFTKSGRVNVRIVRRAYGGGYGDEREVVHVGADRLIIVDALPPTDVETDAEKRERREREQVERERIRATHDAVSTRIPDQWNRYVYTPHTCLRCGATSNELNVRECPNAA